MYYAPFAVLRYIWASDLDLTGWPTFKKIVLDYDFWIGGVTYCYYLSIDIYIYS